MSEITFFTLVRSVCAASFAATALLIVLQLAPRLLTVMRDRVLQLAFAFGLTAFVAAALARADQAPASPLRAAMAAETAPLVARGRYLVENVGMCADCHSPRDERGEFIRARWLRGSPLPFTPAVPMPWAPAAPAIAGLHQMSEAQAVAFLQEGVRPDGSRPRPPMPEFRFNAADARAVVAYLKSLDR